MSWRVEFRPEVEEDVFEAASWYEARQPGLGAAFVEEVIANRLNVEGIKPRTPTRAGKETKRHPNMIQRILKPA